MRILAVVLVVGLLVFAEGSHRRSTYAAEGSSLKGIAPSYDATGPAKPFRVGIFNIDGGVGTDGKRDLGRTARTLEGCDLVGLNEVHAGMPWHRENQAELLGDRMHLSWLFAPTEQRWWQDDFGNGVLCRLPVTHWQRFPLSTSRAGSNRNVVLLRVKYRDVMVNVVITHLDRHSDHDGELKSVAELFLSLGEPTILMGDLNDTSAHPEIHRLQSTKGVTDVTGLAPKVHRDSDWIFSRGLKCVQADVKDEGASDHPFYWADLVVAP